MFEFVSLDRDYSGSIVSCLRAARENARAVRGSLTSELWETLNSTWLDARSFMARSTPRTDIGHFVEWVKERSHLTRGVTIGTMLRDEAFHFTRIGTFIERADSTARILTAHQDDLRPGADASVVPDPYQWSVLLRALSAFEVYRRVYRDVITPYKVAQLLILRDDMPRSLTRCCKEVYQQPASRSRTSNPGKPSGARARSTLCCISRGWRPSSRSDCRIFCSNFSPACAIWVIAWPPTSSCRRRRLRDPCSCTSATSPAIATNAPSSTACRACI